MKDVEKINPLNAAGCRKVPHPPAHFSYIEIEHSGSDPVKISDWIYVNLKHRFYINTTISIAPAGFDLKIKIGFEEAREASFFLLACPLLKQEKK